jgi:chorismate dehydratase
MLAENDAALLIGDTGYQQYDSRLTVLDLGTEWQEWTDLPFVFALWIGRDDLLTPELMATLHTAKEWGKAHRAEIAERRAAEHRTTPERALSYMNEAIHYDLTPEAEAGLRLFAEKVRAHGLV